MINAQVSFCYHSYSYRLIFTDPSVNPNNILQAHIEDPMLYKTRHENCCNECCIDQRDSSIMYKVVFCDETEKELILKRSNQDGVEVEVKDDYKRHENLETQRQEDNRVVTLA